MNMVASPVVTAQYRRGSADPHPSSQCSRDHILLARTRAGGHRRAVGATDAPEPEIRAPGAANAIANFGF
jgi:hypothetical protein